ncbi:hypothetical protein HK097_007769 [Rhizophlyctis rosea]|uniref:Uncharacterized protein n=1 Tax=Rhizophlyctis rosea TaxID=64517 RepID=A0AAD5SJ29_9FUNG|nr:hypothetical protein HK097_007769 [Rhizophlyctis rosea]
MDARKLLKQARAARKDTRPPPAAVRKQAKAVPTNSPASKKRSLDAPSPTPSKAQQPDSAPTKKRKPNEGSVDPTPVPPSDEISADLPTGPSSPESPSTDPTTSQTPPATTDATDPPSSLPSNFFDAPPATAAKAPAPDPNLDAELARFEAELEAETAAVQTVVDDEEEDDLLGRDEDEKYEQLALEDRLALLKKRREGLGAAGREREEGPSNSAMAVPVNGNRPPVKKVEIRRAFGDDELDVYSDGGEEEEEEEEEDDDE